MTELLDFYSQQAKQAFSAEPWLQKLQSQALSALAEQGFPDRKNEDWKYTQVESLLKQEYQAAVLSASGTSTYTSDAPVTNQITLVNGVVAVTHRILSHLCDQGLGVSQYQFEQ